MKRSKQSTYVLPGQFDDVGEWAGGFVSIVAPETCFVDQYLHDRDILRTIRCVERAGLPVVTSLVCGCPIICTWRHW